jgi:hypothetical protein
LKGVEASLEVCDRTVCKALYRPVDYLALQGLDVTEAARLCELPCSAQRLSEESDPDTYASTLPMRRRCQARCEIDGPERSVMCLSYCMSFPDDDGTSICPAILTWGTYILSHFPSDFPSVCAPADQVASIASSTLGAPDCYIPGVFAQNMAYCESQLCRPIDWRQDLVYSNATADPEAYDVCSWACSYYTLGTTMNRTSTNTAADRTIDFQRGMCQDRCRADGLGSFLCRVRYNIEHMRCCKDCAVYLFTPDRDLILRNI